MIRCSTRLVALGAVSVLLASCADDTAVAERPLTHEQPDVYSAANGCFHLEGFDGEREAFLVREGDGFAFSATEEDAAEAFLMRPADLAVYLLYDTGRHFLSATTDDLFAGGVTTAKQASRPPDEWTVTREASLPSAESVRIDRFRSTGEWELEPSERDLTRHQLRHGHTGYLLGLDGLVADPAEAAVITFFPAEDCAVFPELTLDAVGEVVPRQWEDGAVFGFIDAHTHLFTNKGFGGGGMFHGAPFHRLGVEHALPDCDHTHGEEGRNDIISFFFDGDVGLDIDELLPVITTGKTAEFNHHTDGYPTFTDWPSSWGSSTHQTQYYRWIERAYRSGLRLIVELATTNSVLCDFITGVGSQEALYDCNDMVAVDRVIESVYAMERYIDALNGGPGEGWFRVVTSPEQAREVINDGRLAVVLGIETSNLFNCFLTPPEGFEPCTTESVMASLDEYHDRGIRVIFPVHKYDNAFSPGDGHRDVIELANLINSSHYSNFVEDCPFDSHVFDSGNVGFGGLNRPRDVYLSPPPLNMSNFAANPIQSLLTIFTRLREPPLEGNYCQNAGLTSLGVDLMHGLMERGMIIDIAHLPQHSTIQALDILEEAGYPATSTHGDTYSNRLFEIGGLGRTSFSRCSDPDRPGGMGDALRERVAILEEHGLYPAVGFAFDFNGFAGGRRPRFGENSSCPQPQPNPITYPFTSYDGNVEFTQPHLGDRQVDYNTEGFIHLGLLPEFIQDARNDGVTDEELEPLFRSAEAYIRMWEAAERRAAEGFDTLPGGR